MTGVGNPEARGAVRSSRRAGPRVLHVSQATEVGGLIQAVSNLVADQVSRGWEVSVASPRDAPFVRQVTTLGARHIGWDAERGPGVTVPREVLALRRVVRGLNPDVVHLHSSKAGLAGRLAVRGDVPTLFQPNAWSFLAVDGVQRRMAMRWERLAARWTTVLVCVSRVEQVQAAALKVHSGVRMVSNAVDIDRFHPVSREEQQEIRRSLGLPDVPIVVCIGRLTRQKGQDVLVEAWETARREVPDALLVLVGERHLAEPPYPRHVPGVRFVGQRSDTERWLMASDVVALPSRWEGMSYGMLEGLASGRPVVATNVSGAAEAIIAGRTRSAGAVVPVDDPSALGEAIGRRLRDRALRDVEGAEARWRAEERYDLRRWKQEMAALTLEAAARAA